MVNIQIHYLSVTKLQPQAAKCSGITFSVMLCYFLATHALQGTLVKCLWYTIHIWRTCSLLQDLHCGPDLWPKMKVTSVNDQLHLVSDRLVTSPPSVADQSTTRPWHLQNLSEILLRILRLLCIWLWRRCRAVAMYVWQAVTTKFYILVANPGAAQPSPTCVFCLGNLLRIKFTL